ncbi:hypothetical protein D3C75_1361640 [compost metagenome]
MVFDYSRFEEHNKPLENANHYDENGNATMTYREAVGYDPEETHCFEADDEVTDIFVFFDVVSN